MTQDVDLSELDKLPIATWTYPRVLVYIPIERAISHADMVFYNFLELATQGPTFLDQNYGRQDVVRNLAATRLLQSPFTHLLMLDVDHVHPQDIIQRLCRWVLLRPEAMVISGMNFRRGEPYDPVAGSMFKNGKREIMTSWDSGLIKTKEVGAASLLVSRKVFEQIEPPWFFNDYTEVWQNSYPGEDIGFARKCEQNGIDIYIDTTTSSPHCTTSLITEETFRAYQAAYPERFNNG